MEPGRRNEKINNNNNPQEVPQIPQIPNPQPQIPVPNPYIALFPNPHVPLFPNPQQVNEIPQNPNLHEETPQERKARQQREWGEKRKKKREENQKKKEKRLKSLHEKQEILREETKKIKKIRENNENFLKNLVKEDEEKAKEAEEVAKKEGDEAAKNRESAPVPECLAKKPGKFLAFGEQKTKKNQKKEEEKQEKREYVAAKKNFDLQFLIIYYVKKRDNALKNFEKKLEKGKYGELSEEEINNKKLKIINKYNNKYKKFVGDNKNYLDGIYLGSSYAKELPRIIPSGQFQREFFKSLFGERKPKKPIVPIEYILDQRGIKDARRRAANAKHYAKKTGGFFDANFYKTGRKKDFFGEKEEPEEEEIEEEVEEEPKEEPIHLEEEEESSVNSQNQESSSDSESSSSGGESSEESEVNTGRLPPPVKKKEENDEDDEDEEIKIKKISLEGVLLKKKRGRK